MGAAEDVRAGAGAAEDVRAVSAVALDVRVATVVDADDTTALAPRMAAVLRFALGFFVMALEGGFGDLNMPFREPAPVDNPNGYGCNSLPFKWGWLLD